MCTLSNREQPLSFSLYLENLAAWRVTPHIFTRMKHAQSDTVQKNHQHAEPFKPGAQEVSQGN